MPPIISVLAKVTYEFLKSNGNLENMLKNEERLSNAHTKSGLITVQRVSKPPDSGPRRTI